MSTFNLPTELTLDSVSACFSSLYTLIQTQNKKTEELEALTKTKISLQEVLGSFVENPKKDPAVNFFVVDGILKGISKKVLTELQGLENSINSLVSINEKLFIQVGQATRSMKKKNDEICEKFERFVEFTKNQYLKSKLERKKKFIFECWKKESKKNKKLTSMLRKSLIQIHKFKLKTGFVRWKALV